MAKKKETVETINPEVVPEIKNDEITSKAEPVKSDEPKPKKSEKPVAKKPAEKASGEKPVSEKVSDKKAEPNKVNTADDSKEKKKTRKSKVKKIISEDDELTRDTRALLKGAHSKYSMLTGMVERVDITDNMSIPPEARVYVVLHYNNFKIIIPASQMGVKIEEGLSDSEQVKLYRRNLSTMLGANIDYVVTHISEKENIAVGDRMIAMGIKRKKYFQNQYRNTGHSYMEYAMENHVPVEAMVTMVSGSQLRVDLNGVDVKIFARDATWRYTAMLSDYFCPGDKVKVIVKSIHIDPNAEAINVEASIREATKDPQKENASDFTAGSACIGTISGITEKGYHIFIGDQLSGIDSFCNSVHGEIIPALGDIVSVQILKVDYDSGIVISKITRIIKRKAGNR